MQRQVMSTKTLTRSAILVALAIILTRFLSVMLTENLRLGIGWMPIVLTGTLYGPFVGAICGVVEDLLGIIINSQGTVHFGFTLSAMLTGLIPGLISYYFMKNKSDNLVIAVSCIAVAIIVHCLLNTLWLSQLYGNGFLVLLPTRVVKVAIETFLVIVTGQITNSLLKKIYWFILK